MKHLPSVGLVTSLAASLFGAPSVFASTDTTCYPVATLQQSEYSCAGMPILSPANDTRINAMLLMVDSRKLSQMLPDPKAIPPALRVSQLVVPFSYDYSGWIDLGLPPADTSGNTPDTDASSNQYADGEGSICRSMDSGRDAFNNALAAASGLPASDADHLRAARAQISQTTCAQADAKTPAWTGPVVSSAIGQQFAAYLAGTNAFYRRDFIAATRAFAAASRGANPWAKETGLYMVGRAQLNAAQANAFDKDTFVMSREHVSRTSLDSANTVFRAYLKVYPQGHYAGSASGLLRRVAWLSGNFAQQAALYDQAFAQSSSTASNAPLIQLVNEFDSKLVSAGDVDARQIQSPSVLAIVDLMRMRSSSPGNSGDAGNANPGKLLAMDELQAQKPRFAGMPALHNYLLAAWDVYVGQKPGAALALLPQTPSTPLDYFGLSQQSLRAFALEDSGQADKARQLWRDLIPLAQLRYQREALELALAVNLEQAGLVGDVFADNSPIQNAAIRAVLLQRSAGADLLRMQAQNASTGGDLRDIALYTLLYKELTRSRYADFIADLPLVPSAPSEAVKPFALPGGKNSDGYACPSARAVAATLQQNPIDPKGLNCLADFVRNYPPAPGLQETASPLQDADPTRVTVAHMPTLDGAPSQFQGRPYERMPSYVTVMGNAQANPTDRAYAFYRAIKCYAPAGINECGGKEVPKAVRKRWYDTLKASYASTTWATTLKYYW